jgi:hypothetical protein
MGIEIFYPGAYNIFNKEGKMKSSAKFFILVGCLLLLVALILRGMGFYNPAAMGVIKPSSFLILANTAFILAVLLK